MLKINLQQMTGIGLTGTIDEIGRDIQQIKDIGVDHIVFGYNFVPIGRVDKMISLTKELSKFAR